MTGDGSFGRGVGGATTGAQQPGQPPPGYVCYRCKQPGHFIERCPTNGDPAYDVKKTRMPTGIPASFLVQVDDGGLALADGSKVSDILVNAAHTTNTTVFDTLPLTNTPHPAIAPRAYRPPLPAPSRPNCSRVS